MMNGVDRPAHHCFLVRIWQEPDAVAALPQWRGSVKQLAEDKTYYFAHLDKLLAYIAQVSNSPDTKPIAPNLK